MNNALRKTAIGNVTGLQVGFDSDYMVLDGGSWRALTSTELTNVETEYTTLVNADTKVTYEKALSDFLDKKAQERGYDTIHTAALRAALVNSPFHAEGVAYGDWMDACNAQGYSILAQVQAGTIPLPTEDAFIAMMPTLVLP